MAFCQRVSPAIPIKNSVLQNAAKNVDPRKWGNPNPSPINPSAKIPNTSECLAPLTAWLDNLLKQGILQKDDHICYSSDEDFNNVPLQYLRFKKGILLDWFSLSRVHSAFHLDLVLGKASSPSPTQYLGVIVPRLQEYEEKFLADLDAPIQWLAKHKHGHSIRFADATLKRLKTEVLDHRIVHFSTHGYFPEQEQRNPGNPYHDSFLLLADENGLPDKYQAIDKLKQLTPKMILEEKLNLQDSHVSVMACVSGLAKEGIAGDTLGLDCAFIQAGASSLISTHWQVSNAWAAHFFIRFYEKWIKGKQSRASAYRETTLELLDQNYTPGSLYSWAAFSLTGDFR